MSTIDFEYHPDELSSYAVSFGTFIIALKSGDIVHHEPEDSMQFHEWLRDNEVQYLALRD